MKINKNSRQQFWQRGNGKPFLINIKENKRQAIFEIKSIFAISRNNDYFPNTYIIECILFGYTYLP